MEVVFKAVKAWRQITLYFLSKFTFSDMKGNCGLVTNTSWGGVEKLEKTKIELVFKTFP